MSSEDEDYMSDAILKQCADIKPGLVSSRISKQYQKENKQKEISNKQQQTKPKSVLEAEKREQGLKNAIGSENKGFALLSKMGYKPGMAIGKSGEGRKEPVSIELPQGRSGLGHVAEKRKRQEHIAAWRAQVMAKRQKRNENLQANFRQFHSNKHAEKQIERDLDKSRRVCVQLDKQQGDTEPSESFFWPDSYHRTEEEEEEEEEEDNLSNAEKLEMITEYLRNSYWYCIWCGTEYDDEEDLTSNCPGNTSQDHDE